MAVVLREAAHTHDAVQATGRLIAMALAKFAIAQWQIAVALDALLENQDVAGAVHGLESEIALFTLGREHVVAVFVPVTGFFPQRLVQQLRALDFLVAVVLVNLAHVLLNALPDRPAFRVPKYQTRRMVVNVKQVEFLAQLAVVALVGFFQHRQILLQLVFGGPSRSVNTLQHFVAVIAAPISTSHLHELEKLQLAGARHVGATAQIFKRAVAVQRDIFVGRNAGDDLGFVVLADAFEMRHGFVARQHAAGDGFIFGDEFGHALFNRHQIFWRERALVRKIVEKSVFNHRPDGDLRIREQFLDGIRQQVRSTVANQLQAVSIFGCDDGNRTVLADKKAGIDQLAIDLAAQRRFGQAGADGRGNFSHGHRLRVVAFGTVRKRDLDHGVENKNEKARTGRALELKTGVAQFYAAPDWASDQWNCSSSVEPVSAVTLDLPPWITVVTSSK